ncbi:MAG: hypothetical protein ACRYFY_00195 [Janthinobacterium lividum]
MRRSTCPCWSSILKIGLRVTGLMKPLCLTRILLLFVKACAFMFALDTIVKYYRITGYDDYSP